MVPLAINNEADQIKALNSILEDKLSVRKVEELVKSSSSSAKTPVISLSKEESRRVNDLSARFGSKVSVTKNNKGKKP